MSTNSALASARRRRAGVISTQNNDKQVENFVENEKQIKITPIELLQFHEERIKKIEKIINDDYKRIDKESNTEDKIKLKN